MNRVIIIFSLLLGGLPCVVATAVERQQVTYLMQSHEYGKAIDLYQEWKKELGRHDFEILQQMALILLEEGARSEHPENQLISIYASAIGGVSTAWDVLEAGIKSPHPETQVAAIQLLGKLQDDRSDQLLMRAMVSDFFFTRLEAAYQLALRKHRSVVGHLEALMHRLPDEMHLFFPEFFAIVGTSDAIAVLRHMMDEKVDHVRIEAILSAARHSRDDLLPLIRASATHLNIAEQEACAAALGDLKDSRSEPLLKKLTNSPSSNVKLAALKSLLALGDESAKDKIIKLALQDDLFALSLLGEFEGGEETLTFKKGSDNLQIRFNATLALLKRRDPRAAETLLEFLVRDARDLGFQPQFSLGRALMSWKVVPSAAHHQNKMYDLLALSLNVREYLLRECLELPEATFLKIANHLFDARQIDIIPLLISLLENLKTPGALQLLKTKFQTIGSPLIRAYCNLGLFRLKEEGPHEKLLLDWIYQKRNSEMIRFRPLVPKAQVRLAEYTFDLTPEENCRLLVDSLQAIADRHEEKSIDILLTLIKEGHGKNRSLLAGLLLHAIQ